jgi:hypothetical protein
VPRLRPVNGPAEWALDHVLDAPGEIGRLVAGERHSLENRPVEATGQRRRDQQPRRRVLVVDLIAGQLEQPPGPLLARPGVGPGRGRHAGAPAEGVDHLD